MTEAELEKIHKIAHEFLMTASVFEHVKETIWGLVQKTTHDFVQTLGQKGIEKIPQSALVAVIRAYLCACAEMFKDVSDEAEHRFEVLHNSASETVH